MPNLLYTVIGITGTSAWHLLPTNATILNKFKHYRIIKKMFETFLKFSFVIESRIMIGMLCESTRRPLQEVGQYLEKT